MERMARCFGGRGCTSLLRFFFDFLSFAFALASLSSSMMMWELSSLCVSFCVRLVIGCADDYKHIIMHSVNPLVQAIVLGLALTASQSQNQKSSLPDWKGGSAPPPRANLNQPCSRRSSMHTLKRKIWAGYS